MKFEKKSLGSEASSYSIKESSMSYADANPMRRRERGKKEENMVESRERLLLNLLDGSCVGGGASQTEMGGLWELQGRRGEGSHVCKGKEAAQFTTRSSFPPSCCQ